MDLQLRAVENDASAIERFYKPKQIMRTGHTDGQPQNIMPPAIMLRRHKNITPERSINTNRSKSILKLRHVFCTPDFRTDEHV